MRYIITYLLKPLIEYSVQTKRLYFVIPLLLLPIYALISTIIKYRKFKTKTLKNYKKWKKRDFIVLIVVDSLVLSYLLSITIYLQLSILK